MHCFSHTHTPGLTFLTEIKFISNEWCQFCVVWYASEASDVSENFKISPQTDTEKPFCGYPTVERQ